VTIQPKEFRSGVETLPPDSAAFSALTHFHSAIFQIPFNQQISHGIWFPLN